ncbi:hypothetical protein L208DRAFT_1423073 [Tricholoma matsutake]|nr:hypothetical protein L208DRAFT_1423073 [Tricholoma matsutake 945]
MASIAYLRQNLEGQNNVILAIYTQWPTAPKRVMYDFACALGPYCMTREPNFFADTSFSIDHFHPKDHTKCSPAAFLQSYIAVDPQLSNKSISYMSQDHAIIYTQIFISIWNRLHIQNLNKL